MRSAGRDFNRFGTGARIRSHGRSCARLRRFFRLLAPARGAWRRRIRRIPAVQRFAVEQKNPALRSFPGRERIVRRGNNAGGGERARRENRRFHHCADWTIPPHRSQSAAALSGHNGKRCYDKLLEVRSTGDPNETCVAVRPFDGVIRAEPHGFPAVSAEQGHAALGLALRKLAVSGTFMQTAAHPDDEHNALFALFTRGMGLRSIDVQTTRGDGGQNEIGPELFQDIAVLRTSELLAAHRLDGAEQYFTRAIDYGYSFDPQEVINKWGREQIVGDFVRLIRTFRPDVVLTMNIQGRGGDRAHEATTILTREAYQEAGDPTKYP